MPRFRVPLSQNHAFWARQALADGVKPVLVLNKLDKLLLPDAYPEWPELPLLTAIDIMEASRRFPWRTAQGAGGIHPRAIDALSGNAFDYIAKLLMACETARAPAGALCPSAQSPPMTII